MDRRSLAIEGERNRIAFLDNEIDLCHTFLQLAEIDAEDPPVSARAVEHARHGFQTVVNWLKVVRSEQERDRLTGKLYHLKERLDHFSDH